MKAKKKSTMGSKKESNSKRQEKGGQQKPFWLIFVSIGGAFMAILGALALQYGYNASFPVVTESGASPSDFTNSNPSRIVEMVQWIENHDGFIEKQISLKSLVNGRGVFWEGPPPSTVQTTELFKIPQSCFLSSKSLTDQRSVLGKALIDPSLLQQLKAESSQFKLAIVLMAEIGNIELSNWKSYLQLLPKEDPEQPLFWKEFSSLQSPLLANGVKGSINYLQSKKTILTKLSTMHPDIFPNETSIFDKFLWAFYLVSSRSFMFEVDGTPMHTMVPFADLFNHGFAGNPTISVNSHRNVDGSNSMTGVASSTTLLKDGFEIFNQYQSQTTATSVFLYRYGMVDENYETNTIGDYVVLKHGDSSWTVHHDGSVSGLDSSTIPDLAEKVAKAIQTLPTTLEEDKVLLMSSSNASRTALLIRIRFKQVLLKLQNWIASSGSASSKESLPSHNALFELDISTY